MITNAGDAWDGKGLRHSRKRIGPEKILWKDKGGLDKILPELLQNNKITYGGFSAGACVITPSLEGIHLADEEVTRL